MRKQRGIVRTWGWFLRHDFLSSVSLPRAIPDIFSSSLLTHALPHSPLSLSLCSLYINFGNNGEAGSEFLSLSLSLSAPLPNQLSWFSLSLFPTHSASLQNLRSRFHLAPHRISPLFGVMSQILLGWSCRGLDGFWIKTFSYLNNKIYNNLDLINLV